MKAHGIRIIVDVKRPIYNIESISVRSDIVTTKRKIQISRRSLVDVTVDTVYRSLLHAHLTNIPSPQEDINPKMCQKMFKKLPNLPSCIPK